MSESTHETLRRLLSESVNRQEPEALCLSGPWGAGKTHLWNETLREAARDHKVFGRNYCYVSLFGIQSLDQLKTSVVQNSAAYEILEGFSLKDLLSEIGTPGAAGRIKSGIFSIGRKYSEQASKLPYIDKFSQFLSPVLFNLVRDQIICFDDLERCGNDLRVRDVLGLISYLREQRNCKCFLLLNDGELGDQTEEFNRFFEKTFDRKLVLNPSAEESIEVALHGCEGEWVSHFAEIATKLDMRNIRIIRKAARLCEDARNLMPKETLDKRIFAEIIKVLIVSSWCVFMPKEAPPTRFLSARGGRRLSRLFDHAQGRSSGDETSEERIWNERLDHIDFDEVDDLGKELFSSVENGYFQPKNIHKLIETATQITRAQDEQTAFNAAWDIYHDSLERNEDALSCEMHKAAASVLESIIPVNLNSTVTLLREVHRSDLADDLVSRLDQLPITDASAHRLRPGHPIDEVTDESLRACYARRAEALASRRSLKESIERMCQSKFDETDILVLSRLNDQEAINVIHELRGDLLRSFLSTLLVLNDPNRQDRFAVFSCFERALDHIASESPLNARRVRSLRQRL